MNPASSLTRRQFRVLYREFLFRVLDLDLLPQRGDITKLLSQFGAMLAALSLMISSGARRFADSPLPRGELLIRAWPTEDFLIATTMAVVGLFAVLSWDATFPDRRDVLALAPLPVRARTLFQAKAAALGTALGLTVFAVNAFTGLSYPTVLGTGGVMGAIRCLAAYWATMLAAGGFVFCCVLAVQGLAAQLLPRHLFLRVSGFLQLGAFSLVLAGYFLEPPLATPQALADPANRLALAWLPQYWFLALFQALNGSFPAGSPAFAWLVSRAGTGLVVALPVSAVALLAAYFRTLRKIAEQPDILPGVRSIRWPHCFAGSFQTAVVLFSARSLLRSRQHRVIMALYLGIGSALGLAYAKSILWKRASFHWREVNEPLLAATIVVLCFAVLGIRAVFPLPLELRANWVFRITALRGAHVYLAAARRSMIALAVVPVWTLSAAALFSLWPLKAAAGHVAVLGLMGLILADLCLHGFHKIPFTCSYLPGKANVHVTGAAYIVVFLGITDLIVRIELRSVEDPASFVKLLAALACVAIVARLRTRRLAHAPGVLLQFEEVPPSDIFALDLHRDGAPLR
jgi:hypothetical protein